MTYTPLFPPEPFESFVMARFTSVIFLESPFFVFHAFFYADLSNIEARSFLADFPEAAFSDPGPLPSLSSGRATPPCVTRSS